MFNEFEGSSSAPSSVGKDPFQYVIPSCPNIGDIQPKKKKTLQHYFSTPSPSFASANASQSQVQPTQIQSTLDGHWKKQCKEAAYEYIAKWWYDSDIPFNAARSLYYQPTWDSIYAASKGFKGPSMHDLRGSLVKEVMSINEYLQGFRESWATTGCTIMSDG